MSTLRSPGRAKRTSRATVGLLVMTIVAALTLGAGTGASASTPKAKEPAIPEGTTLRVQDTVAGTFRVPLEASGVLKNAPYTVEWSVGASGAAELQALQAGAIDLTYLSEGPPVQALAAGQDIKTVGVWTAAGYPLWIVARPEAGVKKLADLKGKSVATSKGTVLEVFLAQALADVKLKAADVNSVNVLPTQVLAALESGDVDAATIPGQLFTTYRKAHPDAVVLRDGKGVLTGQNYLLSSGAALSNKATAAAIGDFIQRHVKAVAWSQTDKADFIQKLYVEAQKTTPEDGKFLDGITGKQQYVTIDDSVIQTQQQFADTFFDLGGITTKVKVKALYDKRYNAAVQSAIDSLKKS